MSAFCLRLAESCDERLDRFDFVDCQELLAWGPTLFGMLNPPNPPATRKAVHTHEGRHVHGIVPIVEFPDQPSLTQVGLDDRPVHPPSKIAAGSLIVRGREAPTSHQLEFP